MGLLAFLLGALGLGPQPAERAALQAMRGDTELARSEARALLAKHPSDASALFVAACSAVEAGDFDAATAYSERLGRQRAPEASVLQRLIARRREVPGEPLREALTGAWKDVGRPDLSAKPLLREISAWGTLISPVDGSARARMTMGERFAFDTGAPADSAEYVKAAIRASVEADKNPPVINLEILGALTPHKSIAGVDAAEAREAANRAARALLKSDPDNGYLVLAAILASAPGSAPFRSQEVEILERALEKPRFLYPREDALKQLRVIGARLDPQYGELRAWSAALGASVPIFRLWQRAEATNNAELRARLASIMARVSTRLGDTGTTLERALALALEVKAAELRGDAPAIHDANEKREKWFEWQRETQAARKRMGYWPFAAVWREWTPSNEIAYMSSYTN